MSGPPRAPRASCGASRSLSPQPPLVGADSRSSRRLSCNPLNQWSVLDYLSITHFYDAAGCLNEKALAEGKHRCETRCVPLLCVRVPPVTTSTDSLMCPSHLVCGPGEHEYVVTEWLEPALFVVHKRHRKADGAVRRLAVFYVLDAVVYQAPALHALVTSRVSRCAHNLRAALEALRPSSDVADGAGDSKAEVPVPRATGVETSREEARRMEGFCMHTLKRFDNGLLKASSTAPQGGSDTGGDPMLMG